MTKLSKMQTEMLKYWCVLKSYDVRSLFFTNYLNIFAYFLSIFPNFIYFLSISIRPKIEIDEKKKKKRRVGTVAALASTK